MITRMTSMSLVALGSVATAVLAAGPTRLPAQIAAEDIKAGLYVVEPLHTRVQFTLSHMGFTDWYGDFAGISGTLQLDPARPSASRVDITIPVASVSTTSAKVDGELKEPAWFGASQYPDIRFVSDKVVPTGTSTAKIYGTLTFHGVSKPIVLETAFHGAGINPIDKSYNVGFNATTSLKRSDFGVAAYVPLIGDEVTLRISAAFVPKS